MPAQPCPNCGVSHDVSVYVTGQRVLCRCGIRFEVVRADVSGVFPARSKASRVSAPAAPKAEKPVVAASAGLAATVVARSGEVGGKALGEGLAATAISTALKLPGYEMLDLLGRGGMGEVWRATQSSLGRLVAVKVLRAELAKEPDFVARFEKEAAALAALSHPRIVQVIDRGRTGEICYFVMEYVEGQTLREQLGERPFSPAEALNRVVELCRAVDYAHGRGVVHRDLKPENVLVDKAGRLKIADFGLACISEASGRFELTRTSTAMGTFHYMAPEQRKDAKGVDGRADVYSLGVMLYEMLTGEVPVGKFKMPSERVKGLDGRIDRIVSRALEADPAARYPSAAALGEDIELLAGAKGLSAALGALSAVRLKWAVGAALALALATALGLLFVHLS